MSRPDFPNDWARFSSLLRKILEKKGHTFEAQVVGRGRVRIEETGYDNWDGGTTVYTVYLELDPDEFAEAHSDLQDRERRLADAAEPLRRLYPSCWITFELVPGSATTADVASLISLVETQKSLMIAVATGGPKINEVNDQYVQRSKQIRHELSELGLTDPNPFDDLWGWYGKWSADFPRWHERRTFVSDLYKQLLSTLASIHLPVATTPELTGW